MVSKLVRVRLRKFHKWAGILIGVQMIFWTTSGLYFAWMPFEIVKDEDRKLKIPDNPIALEGVFAPSELRLPDKFSPKNVKLENSPVGTIYRLESTLGEIAVFDAFSGQAILPLSQEKAAELVKMQINSETSNLEVKLLREAPTEYKGYVPVYQIALDDFRQTHLYADPWSGRIIARRNWFWRVYDFLWMLHIMDFEDREEFNNPWLRGLSLAAFVLVVSGYVLYIFGRPAKRSYKS